MKNTTRKGFTLIELLVVITIIGILATGATSIFTSQIQKARDSTRLGDIKALQGAVEQVYQDEQEYPHTQGTLFRASLENYIDKFPTDPKKMQAGNKSGYTSGNEPALGYSYSVGEDDNGIEQSTYELSTAFEANGSIEGKAKTDKGNDDNRLETGIDTDNLKTSIKKGATCTANNNESNSTIIPIVMNDGFICQIASGNQY